MDDNDLNTLNTEIESLKEIQKQLFENMQLMIANDKMQINKENSVLNNQALIIKNQEIIVSNQVSIIHNQKKIVSNQSTLEVILICQAEIINALKKVNGQEEPIETTLESIKQKRAGIMLPSLDNPAVI